jgi:hypothetical protein
VILIGIIALSYVGIDLEQAFTTPLLKKNLSFTWKETKIIWNEYVYGPVHNLFNKKAPSAEESGPPGSM